MVEYEYLKKFYKLRSDLSVPEVHPFSDMLLDRVCDRVEIWDHQLDHGVPAQVTKGLPRTIPSNARYSKNEWVIQEKPTTPHKNTWREFRQNNKIIDKKFLKLNDYEKRDHRDFIEFQIAGKVPDELRIKRIDDVSELRYDSTLYLLTASR